MDPRTWLVAVLSAAALASADRISVVPPALREWVPWVMRDAGEALCPEIAGTRTCLALTTVQMDVQGDLARFTLSGCAWAPSVLRLPGTGEWWPEQVRSGTVAVAVGRDGEFPSVRVPAGPFRVSGQLRWTRRPSQIPLPDGAALTLCTVDGRVVEPSEGQLWLQGRDPSAADVEVADTSGALRLKVYRQVQDGVPMQLVTRMEFSVSGRARRVELGGILPEGSLAVRLEADVPAQLSGDGRLSLTARAGTWNVVVGSVWMVPPASVSASRTADPWPAQEVWSFQAAPGLRTVQASGGTPVDARQAGVPDAWAALPSWSLERGASLEFKQSLRGDPVTDSVRTALERGVWIDFDGSGATVVDDIAGQILRPVRLSVDAPLELGRLVRNGHALVVTSVATGEQGVALQPGAASLHLVSRLVHPLGAALPAGPAGWEFSSGTWTVHVGPGWRILDLLGPGRSFGTWAAEWNLWSIFLVVLTAALLGRVAGWPVGVAAAGLFVLGWQDGIGTGWWLHLAVALLVWALVRERFTGSRFEMGVRVWAALAALGVLLGLLPMTVKQVRLVVHPSLDRGAGNLQYDKVSSLPTEPSSEYGAGEGDRSAGVGESRSANSASMEAMAKQSDGLLGEDVDPSDASVIDAILANAGNRAAGDGMASRTNSVMGGSAAAPTADDDPFLTGGVQTGPGEPTWDFASASLAWDGPVVPGQRVRVVAAPPWAMRLWRVVLVSGAWLLAWFLLRSAAPGIASRIRLPVGRKLSILPLVLLLASAAPAGEPPAQGVLDDLREHLLAPEPCGVGCARWDAIRVSIRGDLATIDLEAHAVARGAIVLPAFSWTPLSLSVPRGAAGGGENGSWVVVEPGIQTVRLTGRVRGGDFLVTFPEGSQDAPRRKSVEAPGWQGDESEGNSLHLVRSAGPVVSQASASRDSSKAELAPLALVRRDLVLGREWTVQTQVRRVSGFTGAMALDIPLLEGETVLGNLVVAGGHVKAVLPAGIAEMSWSSRLPTGGTILLRSPPGAPWTEQWSLDASERWHVATTGLPRSQGVPATWHPVPGESLRVEIRVPRPLEGPVVTVQSARLEVDPGRDVSQVVLKAEILAGLGGEILVRLPEGARVKSVQVQGAERTPVRAMDGRFRVEMPPGQWTMEMRWMQPSGGAFLRRAPSVELSAPGANATTVLAPPVGGWIVALGGPGDGPAMLWWGVVFAMGLFAFGLSRIPGQPLGFASWFLLFLGTSTVSKLTLFPFAAWVGLLVVRDRLDPRTLPPKAFQTLQVLVVLATALAWVWLLATIPIGLLGTPDMLIVSPQYEHAWFVDRFSGELPRPWELVLPLWLWRGLLLVWSLWLAASCLKWATWGWNAFSRGGIWPASGDVGAAPGQGPDPRTAKEDSDPWDDEESWDEDGDGPSDDRQDPGPRRR